MKKQNKRQVRQLMNKLYNDDETTGIRIRLALWLNNSDYVSDLQVSSDVNKLTHRLNELNI